MIEFVIGFWIGALTIHLCSLKEEEAQVISIEKGNNKRLTLPLKYGRIH